MSNIESVLNVIRARLATAEEARKLPTADEFVLGWPNTLAVKWVNNVAQAVSADRAGAHPGVDGKGSWNYPTVSNGKGERARLYYRKDLLAMEIANIKRMLAELGAKV